MADKKPRVPDVNYPPEVKTKVSNAASGDGQVDDEEDDEPEKLTMHVLVDLIVSALRKLGNRNGSSANDIQRFLQSEGHNASADQIRAAIIWALKQEKPLIQRAEEAMKGGVYGLYVATEQQDASGASSRRQSKSNQKRSGSSKAR